MTYAFAASLQAAVYQHIMANIGVRALVGEHIYDALPVGGVPSLYIVLGSESVRDASDATAVGAWHDFVVSVVTDGDSFHAAKEVAGAVSTSLQNATLSLAMGRVVGLWFRKANARRVSAGQRRIDLTFRARVEETI